MSAKYTQKKFYKDRPDKELTMPDLDAPEEEWIRYRFQVSINLWKERENKSIGDLAEIIDYGSKTIYDICNETRYVRNPPPKLLARLDKHTTIDIYYILTGKRRG